MTADRTTIGSGVLAGITVLDLSQGIAGSVASMLLADQGAQVTKLEPPGGDPVRQESGAQVWLRSKRSAVVHLPADRQVVLDLAARADVVLDSWTPPRAAEVGLADADFESCNPRLIRCSITAYGADTSHAERPDDPSLVAARTGLMWEQRGWPGGPIARISGTQPNLLELEPPPGCWDGTDRPGPIYPYTPITALAAAYLGTIGMTAGLHARERTGRGQRVETSQWQAVLAATWGGWQRTERPQSAGYDSWVFDSRATRGHFECAGGRWVNHWMPRPAFVLGVSSGDELVAGQIQSVHADPDRIMPAPEDLVVLHHYHPYLREAFLRFPAAEWVQIAAELGVALQPVRTPEEALDDPGFLADGSVINVADPVLGAVRQVGSAVRFSACAAPTATAPVPLGTHTADIHLEARRSRRSAAVPRGEAGLPGERGPLAGLTVLDLGLAVAGPWGTQVLSDLGAEVIKVNRKTDKYWHASHMAMACNRGKRSISIDLKHPDGLAILHRLVERADVVHHNMRADAAERLGIGYEHLRAINPGLIYCHTTGFDDSRSDLPGNDQTGGALAGTLYEDGGCATGGRPMWSLTSLGDIGNGFLSALGVLQAVLHRDRTGEGQLVSTSIVRAQLLATSMAWIAGDGTPGTRPRLDGQQLGVSALRRLYQSGDDEWLCLGVRTDKQWQDLCRALSRGDLLADPTLVDIAGRERAEERLAATLEETFRSGAARSWFQLLDSVDVPCEIASPDVALSVFDDVELIERGWVTKYEQALIGSLEQFGVLVNFSETPARVAGPPLIVGDSTDVILRELGYSAADIDSLLRRQIAYTDQPSLAAST